MDGDRSEQQIWGMVNTGSTTALQRGFNGNQDWDSYYSRSGISNWNDNVVFGSLLSSSLEFHPGLIDGSLGQYNNGPTAYPGAEPGDLSQLWNGIIYQESYLRTLCIDNSSFLPLVHIELPPPALPLSFDVTEHTNGHPWIQEAFTNVERVVEVNDEGTDRPPRAQHPIQPTTAREDHYKKRLIEDVEDDEPDDVGGSQKRKWTGTLARERFKAHSRTQPVRGFPDPRATASGKEMNSTDPWFWSCHHVAFAMAHPDQIATMCRNVFSSSSSSSSYSSLSDSAAAASFALLALSSSLPTRSFTDTIVAHNLSGRKLLCCLTPLALQRMGLTLDSRQPQTTKSSFPAAGNVRIGVDFLNRVISALRHASHEFKQRHHKFPNCGPNHLPKNDIATYSSSSINLPNFSSFNVNNDNNNNNNIFPPSHPSTYLSSHIQIPQSTSNPTSYNRAPNSITTYNSGSVYPAPYPYNHYHDNNNNYTTFSPFYTPTYPASHIGTPAPTSIPNTYFRVPNDITTYDSRSDSTAPTPYNSNYNNNYYNNNNTNIIFPPKNPSTYPSTTPSIPYIPPPLTTYTYMDTQTQTDTYNLPLYLADFPAHLPQPTRRFQRILRYIREHPLMWGREMGFHFWGMDVVVRVVRGGRDGYGGWVGGGGGDGMGYGCANGYGDMGEQMVVCRVFWRDDMDMVG